MTDVMSRCSDQLLPTLKVIAHLCFWVWCISLKINLYFTVNYSCLIGLDAWGQTNQFSLATELAYATMESSQASPKSTEQGERLVPPKLCSSCEPTNLVSGARQSAEQHSCCGSAVTTREQLLHWVSYPWRSVHVTVTGQMVIWLLSYIY